MPEKTPFRGGINPWSDRIVRISANSIVQTDPEGRITWINAAFESLTGYTAAEALGLTPGSLLQCAETDPATVEAIGAALKNRTPIKSQIINRSKSGRLFWLDLEIQPAFDAQGALEGFLAIQTDVSEIMAAKQRKREALQAAKVALAARSAYEEALDLFAILAIADRGGAIVVVNDRFCQVSGYSRDELLGADHQILNSGHHPVAFFADLWQTISSGRPWHGEICNRKKNGDLYWVDTMIVPLLGADSRPEQFVSLTYDITERKIADAQRATLLEELSDRSQAAEAATVAKGQFLANMSHELRTPMNGVIGMLDLLLKTGLDAEQSLRASTALSSARHLLAILNDMFFVSQIESGEVTLDSIAFQPRAVIEAMSPSLTDRAGEKGLRLSWTVAGDVPAWVSGDPLRIRQVLGNLVDNALKFTGQGEVAIGVDYVLRGSDQHLIFAVRDTGIGLSDDAQDKIFGRFVQADASTTRRFGGAGLGLTICKTLVHLMGGEIGVQSTPGAGSTFWFTVLAPAVDVQGAGDPDVPMEPVFDRPLRILAVDDHHVNRMIVQTYLQLAGHEVTLVENGLEAVQAVQAQRFDVVVMDIQMPVMDGLTATRQIRALSSPHCDVPIIALTANTMPGDRERYLAEGMDDYVPKPVDQASLLEALMRVSAPHIQAAA